MDRMSFWTGVQVVVREGCVGRCILSAVYSPAARALYL